ncbi:hypothetical protein JD844_020129 [Phrynosoma platyrhinos]|uniref:Uncharacterized protein n=1 Tax=Phrynosoma platyrhinos TaxID=52577 RepID=A0ABQ7TQW9_PHRPL|nr:hypothetical protein JD844_020129 [Phrynosoma platyrhinos]
MRYAYGALVLTSLIWPKDPSGDLGRQTPREGSLRPCRGESKWTQFHNTFCLYPGLCWVCENPWGPDPQSEMQRDVDFQIPQPRGSLCICGKRLSSDLERQQGPSSVTYHITGARHQNEVRPEYERSRSPSISRGALRTLSSSPSPSSSSSSSSSSSCCLTRLKHLDFPSSSGKFPTTMEDSSSMAYDSSEESESKVSDLCSEAADPKVLEIRHEFSYISLQPERLPRMREMPECAPEEEKSQPVPSFAQINYTQSSAYEKEGGGIVLVERSFEIHMGEMPPDVGRPDPLTSMFAGQEESQEKPKALALLDHMAHPHVGGTLKLHSFPIVPKTPPQTGHLSICTTSALGDFDPDAFVLDKMDEEILNFLEFHVKKKMVQRQCGVPTVVVRSVQRFQSLEDLRHVEFEREHVRPVKRLVRMPLRAKSPAGLDFQARNAMAIGAKPWQKCPGAKEYYILRPVTPEEMKSLISGPAMKKPSVKMALFQGMREKYVLLSMEPDELRRIVFHITVKMLEIKRGTFPEVVERSFRIFSSLSARPLPKTIRWGNKVTRPKHVLLPFVPGEALCLIDLNIQHKYLVHVWRLPTPYSKSEEEMTTAASQPSGPEGQVFKGHKPRDPGMPLFCILL